MSKSLIGVLLLFLILSSCTKCPGLKEEDFSQVSAQETFGKIKAAVTCDEASWAWSTLSSKTREQISYTEFLAGWEFYESDLAQVLDAQVVSSEPWTPHPMPAERLIFTDGSKHLAFLFVKEGSSWFLEYPAPWQTDQLGE